MKLLSKPSLDMFQLHDAPMPIRSGKVGRQWMDQTSSHFAYRCTPLNIANTSGWVAHMPSGFDVTWDGTNAKEAIEIRPHTTDGMLQRYVSSHFGHGILTFHLGWLFKTSPGWAIWARGCPNMNKNGIFALDGIIESEWLNFPFTMNWKFPKPGTATFNPNDPVCFFFLFPHSVIDDVTPKMHDIDDDKNVKDDFVEWRDSRMSFNKSLADREPLALRERWQKKYLHGSPAKEAGAYHIIKRSLPQPLRTTKTKETSSDD